MRKRLSKEQKLELIDKVNASIKSGNPLVDALTEHKINKSNYYAWRNGKELNNNGDARTTKRRGYTKRQAPILLKMSVPHSLDSQSQRLCILIGKPSDVTHALDALARIQG